MKKLAIFSVLLWLTHDGVNQTPQKSDAYINDLERRHVDATHPDLFIHLFDLEGDKPDPSKRLSGPDGAEKFAAF